MSDVSTPLDRRLRRMLPAHDVLSQTVAGESVLLDLRSQKYFGLNAVGTRVWQLLQETEDIELIRDQLLMEYDVEKAQLDTDLDDLLDRLLAAGLATRSPNDPKDR